MKTFYRVDEHENKIEELTNDDIIGLICLMRSYATKDGQFFDLVRDYLIDEFWHWQCKYPEEVDPAFRIFDSVEEAQKQQQENRLTDKLNEEIKEYLETEK